MREDRGPSLGERASRRPRSADDRRSTNPAGWPANGALPSVVRRRGNPPPRTNTRTHLRCFDAPENTDRERRASLPLFFFFSSWGYLRPVGMVDAENPRGGFCHSENLRRPASWAGGDARTERPEKRKLLDVPEEGELSGMEPPPPPPLPFEKATEGKFQMRPPRRKGGRLYAGQPCLLSRRLGRHPIARRPLECQEWKDVSATKVTRARAACPRCNEMTKRKHPAATEY